MLVERKCLVCSAPFKTKQSEINQGNGKYCSRVCGYKGIRIHGGYGTKLYLSWKGMRDRCADYGNAHCLRYAVDKITVCDEWDKDFAVFREWALANGYEDGLELDRKKNHLGYSPENCRWVTSKQNAHNRRGHLGSTSKFKGVSYSKGSKKWKVGIKCSSKNIHLGYFEDEEEAARAYDNKARELFGEYAHLNFPEGMPS